MRLVVTLGDLVGRIERLEALIGAAATRARALGPAALWLRRSRPVILQVLRFQILA